MKDIHGLCNDFSCNCRTPDGYCRVTACIKSVPTVTSSNTSGDYVEFVMQSSVSADEVKETIMFYLKDHTLSDLLKVLADIL